MLVSAFVTVSSLYDKLGTFAFFFFFCNSKTRIRRCFGHYFKTKSGKTISGVRIKNKTPIKHGLSLVFGNFFGRHMCFLCFNFIAQHFLTDAWLVVDIPDSGCLGNPVSEKDCHVSYLV